jgi:cellulose synthase/poly-beta-1,6-N-acetylglucosamine synthase-like glycosyltransferase
LSTFLAPSRGTVYRSASAIDIETVVPADEAPEASPQALDASPWLTPPQESVESPMSPTPFVRRWPPAPQSPVAHSWPPQAQPEQSWQQAQPEQLWQAQPEQSWRVAPQSPADRSWPPHVQPRTRVAPEQTRWSVPVLEPAVPATPGLLSPPVYPIPAQRAPEQSTLLAPPPVHSGPAVPLPRSLRPRRTGQETHVADLIELSKGSVIDAPPSGPTLAGDARRRRIHSGTFVPLLATPTRVLVATVTLAWLTCLGLFWRWWLEPDHRITWVGMLLNSALLLVISTQPAFFFLAANRLRGVNPKLDIPRLRVAMVVTRAPSEPWQVAKDTLLAMLGQRFPYPYDVWICDERPTPEIIEWCAENDVRISTREGEEAYHRSTWPRRTKCKEGNLAYFYDGWGYECYDVVAQFDCDHVPQPDYLAEMVRPFADPSVGYVAAPSICDANAQQSWAARSRLFREAGFQGPFQAGHAGGLAPTCIGSHYAVRTQAIREIGGIGPELAEDFSTAFLLTSAGWQGAFALNAIAHGDGPPTYGAMLTQEFQWSRSLTTLLYDLARRHLRRMPWRLRIRFLNTMWFYPLLAVASLVGTALPPIAAITGVPWVHVSYVEFLARWATVGIWPLLLIAVLRSRGLLRPRRAPVLSWEVWLSSITRWPFVLWGVTAATMQKIFPRQVTFKVTPKGGGGLEPLPMNLVLPLLFLSTFMSAGALLGEYGYGAAGYILLCLLGSAMYLVAAFAVCFLHGKEIGRAAKVTTAHAIRVTAGLPLFSTIIAVPALALAIVNAPDYLMASVAW